MSQPIEIRGVNQRQNEHYFLDTLVAQRENNASPLMVRSGDISDQEDILLLPENAESEQRLKQIPSNTITNIITKEVVDNTSHEGQFHVYHANTNIEFLTLIQNLKYIEGRLLKKGRSSKATEQLEQIAEAFMGRDYLTRVFKEDSEGKPYQYNIEIKIIDFENKKIVNENEEDEEKFEVAEWLIPTINIYLSCSPNQSKSITKLSIKFGSTEFNKFTGNNNHVVEYVVEAMDKNLNGNFKEWQRYGNVQIETFEENNLDGHNFKNFRQDFILLEKHMKDILKIRNQYYKK